MTQPAYRLRPNKAVDRLLFVEAIQRMAGLKDLTEYTYFGLGGPFLEDFRILNDFFGDLKLVCIEKNEEVIKRQQFHLPCRNIRLRRASFHTFLERYTPKGEKSIFWLDYTGFQWNEVEDFMSLLQRVELSSMVKITLRAQPSDHKCFGKFHERFARIIPGGTDCLPRRPVQFAQLILRMLQIAAQRALASYPDRWFQPVSSFFYKDSTPILTLTGVVCSPDDVKAIRDAFETWGFANLDWDRPTHISVPALSTKERLALQSVLPCDDSAGMLLQLALGYKLGDGGRRDNTQRQLQQYASFQKYYPYYVSAVP